VLASPLLMAFWFAPLLTAWDGVSAGKSLFFSFVASWRNWRAFTAVRPGAGAGRRGAAGPDPDHRRPDLAGSLVILSVALRMLLIFVLAPTMVASVYLSYRDVFEEQRRPNRSSRRRPMSEAGAGVLGLFGGTFDPLHVGTCASPSRRAKPWAWPKCA
jgi:hypothetical protein